MFYEKLSTIENSQISTSYNQGDFEYVMGKDLLNLNDLKVLLSKLTDDKLEAMATRVNEERIRNFGRTIQLYTPLYLRNFCENQCVYCAFNKNYKVKRKTLDFKEVEEECKRIGKTGLDEI